MATDMRKQRIRLTEGDLRRIVNRSVRRALNEIQGIPDAWRSNKSGNDYGIGSLKPGAQGYMAGVSPSRYKNTAMDNLVKMVADYNEVATYRMFCTNDNQLLVQVTNNIRRPIDDREAAEWVLKSSPRRAADLYLDILNMYKTIMKGMEMGHDDMLDKQSQRAQGYIDRYNDIMKTNIAL